MDDEPLLERVFKVAEVSGIKMDAAGLKEALEKGEIDEIVLALLLQDH